MINFRKYLFKNIGKRIRDYRKNIDKKSQEVFADNLKHNYHIHFDRYRLSSIENGKAVKSKNPHLLSRDLIDIFSIHMETTPKILIFGEEQERIDFIKLVLLGIIMNGERHYKEARKIINPIIDVGEIKSDIVGFAKNAMFNIPRDTKFHKEIENVFIYKDKNPSKELINKSLDWYKENYGFFAEPIQYKNMNYLQGEHNLELEYLSTLLIQLLFSNTEFASDYMNRNTGDALIGLEYVSKEDRPIIQLMKNEGKHGGSAIDWKELSYSKFIKSFEEMWERNKDYFIEYFEINLFNINIIEVGLKNLTDSFFHQLTTDAEFKNILHDILNKERNNTNTFLGHRKAQIYVDQYNMEMLDASNKGFQKETGYNEYKLISDVVHLYQVHNIINENFENNNFNKEISYNRDLYLYIKSYVEGIKEM
ncbi:MAG TPA: hypothetical protein VK121_06085 [Pseudogracilibacillus sp.]|nr:hypothetical protein [Pseudogracilibacillus sp.]